MHLPAIHTLTFCAALVFSATALATPGASGSFHPRGKSYPVKDAIAWHGKYGIYVLVSEKTLDAPQLLSDFTLDVNDQFNLDGASMMLTIYKTDGSSYSISLRDAESGGDLRCDKGEYLKITRLDETSIAGSFVCEEHNLTFDLPVLKERPGTNLGEGGGEPGKVLLARADAVKASDFDAFLATCSPSEAAKVNAAKAAGKEQLAASFRFHSRITPPDVQVLGGTQVEDRAWVDFANPDRSVVGTMKMLRMDARWLIDGGNLRQ